MANKQQWDILNQTLGYEVATLCLSGPKTRDEIRSKIPYSTLHENQYERILQDGYDVGIFLIEGTTGANPYYVNKSEFSNEEIKEINKRALTRMSHPAETRGDPVPLDDVPKEFFYAFDREELMLVERGVNFAEDREFLHDRYLAFPTNSAPKAAAHVDVARVDSRFSGVKHEPWTTG